MGNSQRKTDKFSSEASTKGAKSSSKMAKTFWSTTRNGIELSVNQANIVREEVECIVNAANEHLAHGGGVAGAISSAAGRDFDRESREYVRKNGIVRTGSACITGSGRLEESAGISKVIHAVGPIYSNGKRNEEFLLYSTVKVSLELAHQHEISSISIPAISSGIFGFPKDRCGEIMLAAALEFIDSHSETSLKKIRLSNFDTLTVKIFTRLAESEEFLANYAQALPKDQSKVQKSQTTAAALLGGASSGTEEVESSYNGSEISSVQGSQAELESEEESKRNDSLNQATPDQGDGGSGADSMKDPASTETKDEAATENAVIAETGSSSDKNTHDDSKDPAADSSQKSSSSQLAEATGDKAVVQKGGVMIGKEESEVEGFSSIQRERESQNQNRQMESLGRRSTDDGCPLSLTSSFLWYQNE